MTDDPETYSEEETQRRSEAALKRVLATPHKPHGKLETPAELKPRRGRSGKNSSE